jgi:hypothetical protein
VRSSTADGSNTNQRTGPPVIRLMKCWAIWRVSSFDRRPFSACFLKYAASASSQGSQGMGFGEGDSESQAF